MECFSLVLLPNYFSGSIWNATYCVKINKENDYIFNNIYVSF